jgi:hypothetical protein
MYYLCISLQLLLVISSSFPLLPIKVILLNLFCTYLILVLFNFKNIPYYMCQHISFSIFGVFLIMLGIFWSIMHKFSPAAYYLYGFILNWKMPIVSFQLINIISNLLHKPKKLVDTHPCNMLVSTSIEPSKFIYIQQ